MNAAFALDWTQFMWGYAMDETFHFFFFGPVSLTAYRKGVRV